MISILSRLSALQIVGVQLRGITNFKPPDTFDHVEFPDNGKLKIMERVPQFPIGVKPPKMSKKLRYMRGPELIHNTFLHKQYGIIALGGGRLKWSHFEVIRQEIAREMDPERMFAVWRVDSPWQPVTKKPIGQTMGGGKGSIDHYVTPIKAGRVIVEVGGKCEFAEVKPFLVRIAKKLPFRAKVYSQETLQEHLKDVEYIEKNNLNPYTMEYVIKNNMSGCQRWISVYDFKWLGKYT